MNISGTALQQWDSHPSHPPTKWELLLHFYRKWKTWHEHFIRLMVPSETDHTHSLRSSISTPGTYQEERIHRFTQGQVHKCSQQHCPQQPQTWKPTLCPSTEGWIHKVCYGHIMQYYTTVRKNVPCNNTMLSKRSQTKMRTCRMIHLNDIQEQAKLIHSVGSQNYKRVVARSGNAHRASQHRDSGGRFIVFCFLIWMLATQVCLVGENPLSYILIGCVFF